VQPTPDVVQDVFKRGRWTLEDQHPADMHVGRRPLLVQEGRVG
jgi:hypothetical protein